MCENLEEVHFSDKIERVEGQSFYGCKNLRRVFIHDWADFSIVKREMNIDDLPKDENAENRFFIQRLVDGS